MARGLVTVRVVLENQEGVDLFNDALELLEEVRDEMPFNVELGEAIDKLKRAGEMFDIASASGE